MSNQLPAPAASYGGLRSAGGARLQGVNLGGWLVAGASEAHLARFIGDADLARLASWRFTHVRLPVDAALLDGSDGWTALDAAIAACGRHGLGCVLALRLAAAELADAFADATGWQGLAARWDSIARRYCERPVDLYFSLLDRPEAPDDVAPEVLAALGAPRPSTAATRRPAQAGSAAARAWGALAVRLTQAIRAVDDRHTIVVESSERASARAFRHLRPTRDSNTIYSFQCFEPEAFTLQSAGRRWPHAPGDAPQGMTPSPAAGKSPPVLSPAPDPAASEPVPAAVYPGMIAGERWDRERLQQLLQPALEFRRVYDAPLYLGAFGASAAAPRQARLTWVRSLVALCRVHGIGWAYWTYKDDLFGLVAAAAAGPPQAQALHQNPQGIDYDLLGVLQSEA